MIGPVSDIAPSETARPTTIRGTSSPMVIHPKILSGCSKTRRATEFPRPTNAIAPTETVLPSDAGIRPVRQDPFSSYRAGFEVRTYRLCQRVLMFHHFADENNVAKDCLVRSTNFNYEFEDDPKVARAPIYSFLTSITQSGYVREGERYLKKSLPSVEFIYSMPEVQDLVEEVDPQSVENLPIGLDGTAYQWTDLHGRGIPGILTEQGGAWLCKRNWSPIPQQLPDGSEVVKAKFAAHETVALKPNVLLSDLRLRGLLGVGIPKELVQLMDRFAEGRCFLTRRPTPGH